MDNISVIIRNRNEERYIGYAIQSVLDTFDKPEIIVVDNNSTDNSMGIVNTFDFEDIKTYNMDSYTPGKSLNYGVTKCSNDYILILSAHSQIMNCDFGKVIGLLHEYCSVGGKQIPIWNGKKISRRYVWSNFIDEDSVNLFSKNENRYFLHNAFAFYKKETLIKHPFDETLSTKEDRYWVNALIKSGMESFYDSATICHHHYTNNGATWKGIG
tara:strand:- start:231 stop:869 length:639 start_codon:yes stop_codon:yes gene_type:complete